MEDQEAKQEVKMKDSDDEDEDEGKKSKESGEELQIRDVQYKLERLASIS